MERKGYGMVSRSPFSNHSSLMELLRAAVQAVEFRKIHQHPRRIKPFYGKMISAVERGCNYERMTGEPGKRKNG